MTDEYGIAVERVLAMVDASAALVAPEDRDDLFEEFAAEMRETGQVPGEDGAWDDAADADIADAHVFLGIGLTLLAQVAVKVVSAVTDMAVERGIREAATYLRGLVRGEAGDDTAGAEGGTGGGDGDGTGAPGAHRADGRAAPADAAGGAPPATAPVAAAPPTGTAVADAVAARGTDGTAAPGPGSHDDRPLALDTASVTAIAEAVAARLALPADVDEEVLRVVVRAQLAAWARLEEPR